MLSENKKLRELTDRFSRAENQLNGFLESDAEIVKLQDTLLLAITTDSIVEEISSDLYHEPYLIGWMTVVANLSDLAAVGSNPLGLVLNQSFPKDTSPETIDAVQKGIQEACRFHNTYILGGDTNESKEWNMGATAIGIIEDNEAVSRKGAKSSDLIYTTGLAGTGNAFAFKRFFNKASNASYSPTAKLKEGAFIRKWASSCIDSSDGMIPALCNIIEQNQCGVKLTKPVDEFLCSEAKVLSQHANIPSWIFIAGPHGDYELIFTVKQKDIKSFNEAANASGFEFICLGSCYSNRDLSFNSSSGFFSGDPFLVANAFNKSGSNPELYLNSLMEIDKQWKN